MSKKANFITQAKLKSKSPVDLLLIIKVATFIVANFKTVKNIFEKGKGGENYFKRLYKLLFNTELKHCSSCPGDTIQTYQNAILVINNYLFNTHYYIDNNNINLDAIPQEQLQMLDVLLQSYDIPIGESITSEQELTKLVVEETAIENIVETDTKKKRASRKKKADADVPQNEKQNISEISVDTTLSDEEFNIYN